MFIQQNLTSLVPLPPLPGSSAVAQAVSPPLKLSLAIPRIEDFPTQPTYTNKVVPYSKFTVKQKDAHAY